MSGNLTDQQHHYIKWHIDKWIPDTPLSTPAVVVNDFVRNCGHMFVYD